MKKEDIKDIEKAEIDYGLESDFETETITAEDVKTETADFVAHGEGSSVPFYLKLIPGDILSFEDEQRLGKIITTSDDENEIKEAKETFVIYNIKLVIHCAARLYHAYQGNSFRGSLVLDDFIQSGMKGLLRAVDRFDYSLGFKFSTYATHWINQAIRRDVADEGYTVRIPVHLHEFYVRYMKHVKLFIAEYQREPKDNEIVDILYDALKKEENFEKSRGHKPNSEEKEAMRDNILKHILLSIEVFGTFHRMVSLDNPVGEEEDSTIGDFISSDIEYEGKPDLPTPEETANALFYENFSKAVRSILDCREWNILVDRFGLNGGAPMTLEQCGAKYGITRERVRQIESKAIRIINNDPDTLGYSLGNNYNTIEKRAHIRYLTKQVFTLKWHLRNDATPDRLRKLVDTFCRYTGQVEKTFIDENNDSGFGYNIVDLSKALREFLHIAK